MIIVLLVINFSAVVGCPVPLVCEMGGYINLTNKYINIAHGIIASSVVKLLATLLNRK